MPLQRRHPATSGIINPQPLAADPIRGFPQRHQRIPDSGAIGRPSLPPGLRQNCDRMASARTACFAMPAGHRAKLVENAAPYLPALLIDSGLTTAAVISRRAPMLIRPAIGDTESDSVSPPPLLTISSSGNILDEANAPIAIQLQGRRGPPIRISAHAFAEKTRQHRISPSSWYSPQIMRLLSEDNRSLCISDHHDAPAPWRRTADFVYVRGHGPGRTIQGTLLKQMPWLDGPNVSAVESARV